MSVPLLTTKFHISPQRVDLVPRPHLIERLNVCTPGKLTFVTAPAGFGKTTLVTDWIANALPTIYRGQVSWLSLDSADNTPIQFWTYVIAALQRDNSSIGKKLQSAFQAATPLPPIETVLTALINEIALNEQPSLIGLDDYHEITNPEIHQGVAFLIENLPPNLHLVILSREDLPFSISRYRVNGKLTEIRAADLRFSQAESTAFFNDLLSLSLTSDDVKALNTRTEGWVAGLQLAALSLKSTDDKSGFIQAFAGSHRFLTDYLVDEVLSRQTETTQKFLWRTSILERFCAEICDELIDEGDSRAILRQLEQANLFIVPLDNERRWFRYHHLFAEFLRLHLRENESDIIPDLYLRSIDWFEKVGLQKEALQYALQAEAYERAADLIETLAPEILEHDNHMLVVQWINTLPRDLVNQSPYLCVYMGWAYVLAGQMEVADHWLTQAESQSRQLAPEAANIIRGHVVAHRTYIVAMQGNYTPTIDYAQQALDLLPSSETALRARTVSYLGNAYSHIGQLQDAKNAFWEAITIAKEIESLSLATLSFGGLAEVLREEGHLTAALDVYQQFLQFAEDLTGKQELPLTGNAILEIGVIYRERHELDDALDQIKKGVNLCREWQQRVPLAIGLMELAELHRLQGKFDEAAELLYEARQLGVAISPWALNLVEGIAARLSLSRGDLDAVVHWAENAKLDDEAGEISYERFPECPALIRMYIQTGNAQRALKLLEKMMKRDRAAGRMGRVLDLMILQVTALDALGETDAAFGLLADAVQLACPENHLRPFVNAGVMLVPYLSRLPESALRARLLDILGGGHPASLSTKQTQFTSEPLNAREREILRLMSVGNSNREIGDELYLSVNTIRWYASQIYMKLGVKNRGEAVARARELGVL